VRVTRERRRVDRFVTRAVQRREQRDDDRGGRPDRGTRRYGRSDAEVHGAAIGYRHGRDRRFEERVPAGRPGVARQRVALAGRADVEHDGTGSIRVLEVDTRAGRDGDAAHQAASREPRIGPAAGIADPYWCGRRDRRHGRAAPSARWSRSLMRLRAGNRIARRSG
jgi:hypothetical protein